MENLVKGKQKILIVDNLGVEASRRTLYRYLASQQEFEVNLCVPKAWREQSDTIKCEPEHEPNLHLYSIKTLFGYRAHRVIYPALFKLISTIKPHLTLVDSEPENYLALQALLTKKLFLPSMKVAIVSWRNIDYIKVGFPYRFELSHRICNNYVLPRVDICFFRSKSAEELLSPYVKRGAYFPWSVDCSIFRKMPQIKKLSDSFTIGYIGRFVPSKGIHLLIEALTLLPPNIKLLLVGKGPEEESLKHLVKRSNLNNRVIFKPAVAYSEVPNMLNLMDVFVLPSIETKYWIEQFGRILIEAMACETPVVASHTGEIPKVVNNAGLLFQMGNVQDLAEKILRLMQDKILYNEISSRGRVHVLQNFDVPVVAKIFTEAINSI